MIMKRNVILIAIASMLTLSLSAQQARNDIRQHVELAGSNYVAYPGPKKALTAAPNGY